MPKLQWYITGGLSLIFYLLIFEIIRLRAKNKKISDILAKAEEKFSKAFWQSPLSITVFTAKDRRYMDINETFERVTGWRRNDVIGRTPLDIGLWMDSEASLAIDNLLLTGNGIRNLEVRTRTKNGELRTSLASADLMDFNGQPCVIVVTTDITPLKQAEETLSIVSRKLIEAHEQERAWLARELHDNISHRLCLLIMRLENLRRSGTAGVEFRYGIRKTIREVSDLAGDMQRLSHRLHPSKVEFLGLAMATGSYCGEVADQHKVEIDLWAANMPPDLSAEISLSIFRVLQEALQNAIKHSGSYRFQVLLKHKANEIHLTVRDSGTGFDAVQAIKGHGLGLTSMKERIALVDGELSIDSQPNNGTTIDVRVPLQPGSKSGKVLSDEV